MQPVSFSQQVIPSSKRLSLKVVHEGDCKKITMDIPILYTEVLSKCIKNFGLAQLNYVLVSSDDCERVYIDSQESLSRYLIRQQQKTSGLIKLGLVKDDRGESDGTREESG